VWTVFGEQFAVFGSPFGLIHLAVVLQRYSKLGRVSVFATNFAVR
jgi:hypothetical protein